MSESETRNVEAVLAANQEFYRAFAQGDVKAMDALWAQAVSVACAHPGAPLLVGREPVLESWRSILTAPGAPKINCFGAQAHMLVGAAYVTCYERLGARGPVLLATNVYVWEANAWRMAHHHAGPTPAPPPAPVQDDDAGGVVLH